MKKRFERLIHTFIAKKYVAWLTACFFLGYGKITGTDWALFTAGIFCIDAYSKAKAAPWEPPAPENSAAIAEK